MIWGRPGTILDLGASWDDLNAISQLLKQSEAVLGRSAGVLKQSRAAWSGLGDLESILGRSGDVMKQSGGGLGRSGVVVDGVLR